MTPGVRRRPVELAAVMIALMAAGCVKVDLGAIVFGRGDASTSEAAIVFDTGGALDANDVTDATIADVFDAPTDTPDDITDARVLPQDVLTSTDAPIDVFDGSVSPDVTPTVDVAPDVPMSGCPTGLILCGAACVDLNTDAMHCGFCGAACPSGVCAGGRCQPCTSPRIMCGTACVDLNTDTAHCGACGRACPSGIPCVTGTCGAACSLPMILCGATCVDLNTNAMHCGMCGAACPVGRSCVGGVCVP